MKTDVECEEYGGVLIRFGLGIRRGGARRGAYQIWFAHRKCLEWLASTLARENGISLHKTRDQQRGAGERADNQILDGNGS